MKKILVVDDETYIMLFLTMSLEDEGYTVLEATNVNDAIDTVNENADIDILITDIHLSAKINGHDFAEHAKSVCPNIKVLFISGGECNEKNFLTKPFNIETLLNKMKEL